MATDERPPQAQLPAVPADAPPPPPAFPHRRRSQGYWVVAAMQRLPGARFCCGCLCLRPEDRRQLKRVFRLTRAARKARAF